MGTNIWKQRSHYGLLKSSPALPNMGFIFHAQRAPSQRYQPTKLLWKTRTATINGLFKTGAWKKGRIIVMCLSTFSYKYSLSKTKMLSSDGIVTDWTMMWSAVQYYKLDNGFVLFIQYYLITGYNHQSITRVLDRQYCWIYNDNHIDKSCIQSLIVKK